MECLCFSQAHNNVLVVLWTVNHYGDRSFRMFSIGSPVLSFILSSDLTSLVFVRAKTCFGWLGHSCGLVWFNGGNRLIIDRLISGIVGLMNEIVGLIVDGRNWNISEWSIVK